MENPHLVFLAVHSPPFPAARSCNSPLLEAGEQLSPGLVHLRRRSRVALRTRPLFQLADSEIGRQTSADTRSLPQDFPRVAYQR
jgi:hypothetical protein